MVINTMTLDIAKFKNNKTINVKEDNVNANILVINITNFNRAYNLTNATAVRLYFNGETISFIDATISDAEQGIVQFNLTTSMLANVGTFPCNITIYEADKEINADTFYLNVVDTIKEDSAIEATNEFTALTEVLDYVNSIVNEDILQWYGTTSDETETEIFLGGTSNKRATVLASSAFMYSINVVAYDSTNNVGMTFKIEGGIKRDTANNTSLIGTPTTTIISQDGTPGWTITASDDDTNEALVLKVTGAAGTTIKWDCVARITELRI